MRKGNQRSSASYRPMPNSRRFWLHAEHCYTEEELRFRETVIQTRAHSGIHPDYLSNPSSWFAPSDQALSNQNEHSWFYANAYHPRHVLTRLDFHVQPVDGQRLQWPSIYNLMRQVGNYLLRRNEGLPNEHLNQPMNYVLLDINFMLKGLSQNPNIAQVQGQLALVNRYVRTIESNTSPLIGSDRLFLSDFRDVIDEEIHPQLQQAMDSQQLQEHLKQLSRAVRQVSFERNLVLHFALHKNRVLPHPYEYAAAPPEDLAANPVHAARVCGQQPLDLAPSGIATRQELQPQAELSLDARTLSHCTHFSLVSKEHEITAQYAVAISDLDNLERFQEIISEVVKLLGPAGEVYTVHRFREQMLHLLRQLNHFLEGSSVPIEKIIKENTKAYHKAIQDQQDLSSWQRIFTSDKEELQQYIDNQDTLARFPAGIPELALSRRIAQENTNTIIGRLSQPQTSGSSVNKVVSQVQELTALLGSMDHWINYQHKGLQASAINPRPSKEPDTITVASKQYAILINPTSSTSTALPVQATTANPQVKAPPIQGPTPARSNSAFFQAPPMSPAVFCSPLDVNCQQQCPIEGNIARALLIGAALALPFLALLFLYKRANEKEQSSALQKRTSSKESKAKFKRTLEQVESLIAQIRGYEADSESDWSASYCLYLEDYQRLKSEYLRGHYDLEQIEENLADLQYVFDDVCLQNSEPLLKPDVGFRSVPKPI